MKRKILVTGALGQIGSELIPALRKKFGNKNVIAVGHRKKPTEEFRNAGPLETADARNKEELETLIKKYDINTIYNLVGVLSAVGEKYPDLAWDVNMNAPKNYFRTYHHVWSY